MTDAEIYALKEAAREAAREIYKQGPQWVPGKSAMIQAFADGAQWQAQRDESLCAAMRGIVEEVAGAGVSFSDPRVSYVEMQLSAGTKEEAKAAMAKLKDREAVSK